VGNRLIDFIESVTKIKKDGGICTNKNKLTELQDKIKYLRSKEWKDDPLIIAQNEKRLLGIAISANKIDVYGDERITHTCKDALTAAPNELLTIGVDILECKEFETKSGPSKGKKRAALIVCDSTAKIKAMAWSDCFEIYHKLLIENNTVILVGTNSFGKYAGQFNISAVIQP